MEGHVVAEISVVPIGTGKAGVSSYIAACLEVVKARKELSFQLTSMGTIIEGPLKAVLEVTGQMHEVPFNKGALRVVTTLKIDERRDKVLTMDGKVESVVKQQSSSGEK